MERDISACYGSGCLKCPDPCQLHDCGVDVIREKQDVLAIHNGQKGHVYLDTINPDASGLDEFIPEVASSDTTEESRPVLDAINRMAFLYLEAPRVFDALIRRIYQGKNQAQMARERGLTRAAVSKELREGVANLLTRELGMRAPIRHEKLLKLTTEEFQVYKLCFLDGCTIRSAAVQLGKSKDYVYRVRQKLSLKLDKSATKKVSEQKKS